MRITRFMSKAAQSDHQAPESYTVDPDIRHLHIMRHGSVTHMQVKLKEVRLYDEPVTDQEEINRMIKAYEAKHKKLAVFRESDTVTCMLLYKSTEHLGWVMTLTNRQDAISQAIMDAAIEIDQRNTSSHALLHPDDKVEGVEY